MADQEIGALKISLSLQEADFSKSMTEITRKIRGVNSEFKVASAGVDGYDRTLAGMQANSRRLTSVLELQRARVANLKAEYDRAASAKDVDAKTVDNLARRYNSSAAAMKNTESQLNAVNSKIREQSTFWGHAASQADKFRATGDKVSATGRSMMQGFGTATVAVGAGLGVAAKSAMDFESQMSGVKSVMAPDEVRKYSKELENLAIVQGSKTAFSATQAAQAEEELVKAGVSVKDIIHGGLSGALNLATAGSLDLKDAAEIASTALNAFKKDGLSVAQAADILAGAANASATDVGEMKFALSMSSAVAAGVGLTFKDTATALAVFAQNGLKGSDAGTSLKTMLMRLEPQTDKAAAQFEKLGLMTFDASKAAEVLSSHGVKPLSKNQGDLIKQLTELSTKMSGAKEGSKAQQKAFKDLTEGSGAMHSAFYDNNGDLKDMSQIAQLLKGHMKNLTNEQRQNALGVMFGSDAVRGATVLYREGAKGVDAMATSMGKVSAADVARQKLNNMKGTLEQLRGSLETAGITIGNSLLPTLRGLTRNVQGVVDWFNKLDPATQQWIGKMALGTTATLGVGTAMGAMTMAIGGGIKQFSNLAVGVNTVVKAFGEVKAARAAESVADIGAGAASSAGKVGTLTKGTGLLTSVIGGLTSPVGLVTLGIGAAGLAAYGLYHHFTKLADTSTAAADALDQQRAQLTPMIDRYDELKSMSTLTSKEFGRFVDIQARLKKATSADEIKRLKDEADKLQNKSSLSNKELDEMVSLNGDLVKKVPGATDAITKQGNRIAESTDKAKKYNAALLEQQLRELEIAKTNAEGNEAKYKREIKNLQDQLNVGKAHENDLSKISNYLDEHGVEATKRQFHSRRDINQLLANGGESLHAQLGTQMKQNDEDQKKINNDKKHLNDADELRKKYADTLLKTVGINDEGKKGMLTLGQQVEKQKDKLAAMDKEHDKLAASGKMNTSMNEQYQEGRKQIQGQIDKLEGVNGRIKKGTDGALDMNKELRKDIDKKVDSHTHTDGTYKGLGKDVNKNVNVKTNLPKQYYNLTDDISKNLYVKVHNQKLYDATHAAGVKNLPHDEIALVGEAGREFVHDKKFGTYLVNEPTIVPLSAGASVLKNADTERLGKSLGLPGFAAGVGGAFDSLMNRYVPDVSQTAVAQHSPSVTVNSDNSALVQLLTQLLKATQQQNNILITELGKTPVAQVDFKNFMGGASDYQRHKGW
jgi:TP901 family phage tail tape measure protein